MTQQANIYLRCVHIMLRPVVRFCLRNSVRLQQLNEILKQVLIEVASEEIANSKDEPSVSRLHIMTGVHRADVARIYKRHEPRSREDHIVFKVMNVWMQGRRTTTSRGEPRVLSIDGTKSDFFDLVSSVSKDLNPYTVLFEMERLGVVARTPRGLKLVRSLFQPENIEDGIKLLSDDVEDLMDAVNENIGENPPIRNLHIKTEYTNVPLLHLNEIRRWFVDEGAAFHAKARGYLSQFDRDINPRLKEGGGQARVAVCSFSFVDPSNKPKG